MTITMTCKPKLRYSLTHSYMYTTSHLKLCNLPTQPLKHFHQTYECCVTSTYSLAGLMHNHLETTHYLRSIYMPTAKSTTYPTISESSTKAQSTFYKNSNDPTQDEIYHVVLAYPHYVRFDYYNHGLISMCNYNDCTTCPFTTPSSGHCFLDLINSGTYSRLQQSHPELFL